ncbi:MAG: flagellar biosynthesis anti-sigma factor FlgM [Candidatus Schekmanbacteria bacterium RBG_13_48_7]|uniref:Negative regulator of flagellin synthesis n=1 Tax=Candidatus Schekmanbacteria bacterium RBG_13_48_7 TaxID=1817878 RepID=A0A1F7RX13_9BACT|nr:MAG: flagellar biosynthesis anti-sigma factor FlgM [Candidatus Schekmanbacteria bacterium RBG_13_48_7]
MKINNQLPISPKQNDKQFEFEKNKIEKSEKIKTVTILKDKVQLSKKAATIQRIQDELLKLDKEHLMKLESIRQSVKMGTYNVSGEKIAEKMINDAIIPPTPRI